MKQKIIKFLIGIVMIVVFILTYFTANFGKIIESSLYDKRFDIRGEREASKDIVIVAVDNFSMKT